MKDLSLVDFKVNHIGIVIPVEFKSKIERDSGNYFLRDEIQGVSICFVWDENLKLFKEYITQEGRAKNYDIGYNHICYDIESQEKMKVLHKFILENKIGIRLTLPEPSPSQQSNLVTFYKFFGLGIIEFNILD